MDNGMVGKYVIVRCTAAGVHTGVLEKQEGQEVILSSSRRLWYWKPLEGKFLSGVAIFGLHKESKVGVPVERLHLTEACETILCSSVAEKSIQEIESD